MSDSDESWTPPAILVAVDLVILTLRQARFHVLLVERGIEPFLGAYALPGGFLDHAGEDVRAAALRELREEADLDGAKLHVEQLGAYGAPDRDPRGRVLSVAYLAIAPSLPEPTAGGDASGASWAPVPAILSGQLTLAFDHRRILDDAIEKARSKLEHTSLATAFCAADFTITELQRVYEAVWGVELDPRNFYRKVQRVPGFIEAVAKTRRTTKGRPARVYRAGPAKALHPPITRPESAQSKENNDDR